MPSQGSGRICRWEQVSTPFSATNCRGDARSLSLKLANRGYSADAEGEEAQRTAHTAHVDGQQYSHSSYRHWALLWHPDLVQFLSCRARLWYSTSTCQLCFSRHPQLNNKVQIPTCGHLSPLIREWASSIGQPRRSYASLALQSSCLFAESTTRIQRGHWGANVLQYGGSTARFDFRSGINGTIDGHWAQCCQKTPQTHPLVPSRAGFISVN